MKEAAQIYEQMLQIFEEKTGFRMEDTADLAVRLYAAAAQIETLYAYADWALVQSFPQTATGKYLDYHAELRGIKRQAGKKAAGTLRRIPAAIPLILSQPDPSSIAGEAVLISSKTENQILIRLSRKKQIIRTRLPLGKLGSDYIGLCVVYTRDAGFFRKLNGYLWRFSGTKRISSSGLQISRISSK